MYDSYIVGFPSGEVIDIKPSMINFLKQEGLISFNPRLQAFIYLDEEYITVNRNITKLKNNITSNVPSFSQIVNRFMSEQKDCETYNIHNDRTISVHGSIILQEKKINILPISFREVTGNFIINNCDLTNLKGVPIRVGNDFDVSGNLLFDLKNGPKSVQGNYDCSDNMLISLEGAPEYIKGYFNCSKNMLTNLKYAPKKVGYFFNCKENKKLISLLGLPQTEMVLSDIKKIRKFRDGNN
jgi:hypothetical protein